MVALLLSAVMSFGPIVGTALAAPLPELLKEVEQKYAKAATLEADFTQVTESVLLKKKKTTSGVIRVKRPDKVRWETLKPVSEMSLLVSDGKTFWFYTPPMDESEHGQVIERKSGQVQSRLAQALLSGSFSIAKDMGIKQDPGSRSKFTLTPRKGTAGTVKKAHIEVDPEKKLITRVIIENEGGNDSEITLSNIELGKNLAASYFSFTPPPNTDRVRE